MQKDILCIIYPIAYNSAIPNLFGTWDWFRGRQFFHRWERGEGGMVQVVMQVMGRDGEQQMKLCWLACRSPPSVWPSS